MELFKEYINWRKETEELMDEYPETSVDCGEACVREDFSNYIGLQESISFEEMLKLEKNFKN